MLTPETYERVKYLFTRAVERPAAERAVFLDEACGGDTELRALVERMLHHHEQADGFLEEGILPEARERIAEALLAQSRAETIAWAAREAASDEREELLARECGDDAELRRWVDSLLEGDAERGVPAPDRMPAEVGGYRLVGRIASGGMGTVYEAEQERPRRKVALKLMRRVLASRHAARRFTDEAEILGRMSHPGIAQVYEAGTFDDGTSVVPYFAMEYVEGGRTLTDHASDQELDLRARLELFARVCDAVAHGHQKGVVHRDLKPGNILVNTEGHPKVIDFGLARAVDADLQGITFESEAGQIAGTLPYMSPEQTSGDVRDLDIRSDVYSLGVVLYELLCGSLPYQLSSGNLLEAVRTIREQRPRPPSSHSQALGGDVETILLKALAKEPDQRYLSAAALGDDVRRYLSNQPIQARPPSLSYELRLFARRNRLAFLAAASVVLAIALAAVASTLGLATATEARRAEQEQREQAEWQHYTARIAAADGALQLQDAGEARRHLERVPEDQRQWEWRHLSSRVDESSATLPGRYARGLRFSRDGTRLAFLGGLELEIWDVASRRKLRRIQPPTNMGATKLSADFERVVWGPNNNRVSELHVVEVATGEVLLRVPTLRPLARPEIALSEDGRWLAVTERLERAIRLYDVNAGVERRLTQVTNGYPWWVGFNADASVLLTNSAAELVAWDTATGARLDTLQHVTLRRLLAFDPATDLALDVELDLMDLATGEAKSTLHGQRGRSNTAAIGPEARRVAAPDRGGAIRLWDAMSGETLALLRGHETPVVALAFDPRGSLLASANADSVKLWDMRGLLEEPLARTDDGSAPALSGDGKLLATREERQIAIRETASGRRIDVGGGLPRGSVLGFALDAHGRRLAIGSHDGEIVVWDRRANEPVTRVEAGADQNLHAVALSADGKRLAAAIRRKGTNRDVMVVVWDADTGLPTLRLENVREPLTFSPDSRYLAGHLLDGGVGVWDVESNKRVHRLDSGARWLWDVVFFPSGDLLLQADSAGELVLWDLRSGKSRGSFKGHAADVRSLAVRADGRRFVSGDATGTLRLWDPDHLYPLLSLPGLESTVAVIGFVENDVLAVDDKGNFRRWDTATPDERVDRRELLRLWDEQLAEARGWILSGYRRSSDPAVVRELIESEERFSPALRPALSVGLREMESVRLRYHQAEDPTPPVSSP